MHQDNHCILCACTGVQYICHMSVCVCAYIHVWVHCLPNFVCLSVAEEVGGRCIVCGVAALPDGA